MCGIAGIYNFRSGRPAAQSELRAMGACLAHRGPDDEGYYEEGPLGLAHKRLTILDTSRRGRQPMFTEDGQLASSPFRRERTRASPPSRSTASPPREAYARASP